MRTLVLGGTRSGKSAVAEGLVAPAASCCYVATARPFGTEFDADFAARISLHQARRPQHWETEAEQDLLSVLAHTPATEVVLVDDLGTWLTHQLDRQQLWQAQPATAVAQLQPLFRQLAQLVANFPVAQQLILVSPEVGLAPVAPTAAGRLFADALGSLNQQLAAVVDRAFLVVAGRVLELADPSQL